MHERTVAVPMRAGRMETFITHPEQGGPFPAVVMYMDFRGVREELFDIARRVATVGYYCMIRELAPCQVEYRCEARKMISWGRS